MSYRVKKQGHADWADLKGKTVSFPWSDGYEDWGYVELDFDHTRPYYEDLRYPRYYVVDENGGGYSLWENETVEVTVHERS